MSFNWKKASAILCCCGILSNIFCADINSDWLEILKKKVGDQPCPGEPSDIASIRENKHPGECYLHILTMTLDGKATAASSRVIKWWGTKATVDFRHETILQIRERIVSTPRDLNKGIIRSRFEVIQMSENMITAKAGINWGDINSVDVLKFIHQVGKEHGDNIDKAGDVLLRAGLAALAFPDLGVSKGTAVATLAGGGALKIFSWASKKAPEDGYIQLDKDDLKKFPDYDSFVTKLSNWDGSIVEATWECGKGYTQIDIKNSRASEDDKLTLAKLIYRTNPAVSWRIYPKKMNDIKTIDASEIGGLIFTKSMDYDRVIGQIQVKNRGIVEDDKTQYEDIVVAAKNLDNHRKNVSVNDLTIDEIGIMENGSNIVKLQFGREGNISAAFIPHGSFYIVKVPEMGSFVRKASIKAKLDARIENRKGFLREIQTDERDVNVSIDYKQIFLGKPESK